MNHGDEIRSEADKIDNELVVYNDAINFAKLFEASSLGTPAAVTTRRAGGGVLERYRFTPPHLTADEPQASDLAQFVSEHFQAQGRSDVADLWQQAAVVEDGALPTSSPSSVSFLAPSNRNLSGASTERRVSRKSSFSVFVAAAVGAVIVLTLSAVGSFTGVNRSTGGSIFTLVGNEESAPNIAESAVWLVPPLVVVQDDP